MNEFLNQYFLSGAVAALAHELIYWTNVIRRKNDIRFSLLLMSVLYVLVGSLLAGLAAQEPHFQKIIPYSFGIGFLWGDFLKGLSGVVVTISKSTKLLEEKMIGISSNANAGGE